MGRIGKAGRSGWRTLRAVVAGAILTAAALAGAQNLAGGDTPRIGYGSYPLDERLTLAGETVRSEAEALRVEALTREMARVRASQAYQPTPAIWKIGDADTTIYIFGTVHSLPPGFRWRNPVLEGVIVRADTLVLESTDDENDDVTFLEGLPKDQVGHLPPLLDRVSHRWRYKLAQIQNLLPPETVKDMDAMPTWIAAMGIGFVRDLLAGDMPSPGADDWLERHFRAIGKPVEAIEDSKAVVTNLNAVPEVAQRLMLEAALAAPEHTHAELDAPAHAWAQGKVDDDSPLRIIPEELDPSAAMADPLLARRNADWVHTLTGRMMARPGVFLFAAGAGHFVGPGSVIDLLRKRGVRVERVQ